MDETKVERRQPTGIFLHNPTLQFHVSSIWSGVLLLSFLEYLGFEDSSGIIHGTGMKQCVVNQEVRTVRAFVHAKGSLELDFPFETGLRNGILEVVDDFVGPLEMAGASHAHGNNSHCCELLS
jgi:hypothetical protein